MGRGLLGLNETGGAGCDTAVLWGRFAGVYSPFPHMGALHNYGAAGQSLRVFLGSGLICWSPLLGSGLDEVGRHSQSPLGKWRVPGGRVALGCLTRCQPQCARRSPGALTVASQKTMILKEYGYCQSNPADVDECNILKIN